MISIQKYSAYKPWALTCPSPTSKIDHEGVNPESIVKYVNQTDLDFGR